MVSYYSKFNSVSNTNVYGDYIAKFWALFFPKNARFVYMLCIVRSCRNRYILVYLIFIFPKDIVGMYPCCLKNVFLQSVTGDLKRVLL